MLSTSEVFDLNSLTKTFALYALLGAWEFDWKDIFFYYNPYTSKIEIIAKEIHTNRKSEGWWYGQEKTFSHKIFIKRLFDDPAFVSQYFNQLQIYTHNNFVKTLKIKLSSNIKLMSRQLKTKYYDNEKIQTPWLDKVINEKKIKSFITPKYDVQAYIDTNNAKFLNISTSSFFSLGKIIISNKSKTINHNFKLIIPPSINKNTSHRLPLPENVNLNEQLFVSFKIGAFDNEYSIKVLKRKSISKEATDTKLNVLTKIFNYNEKNKTLECKAGETIIKTPLKIPKKIQFHCEKAASITLAKGASLIFQNNIYISGTKNKPLTINGQTGAEGISVIDAPGESFINYLISKNLGMTNKEYLRTSGAINFYNSDVSIMNSEFYGNQTGDDILNIVLSKVNISHSNFHNSLNDALDLDFTTGVISNINITNSGNDGLDISNSNLTLSHLVIIGAQDKLISIGEQSNINLNYIDLEQAPVCLANKDGSITNFFNSNINKCQIGLSVYIKKEEYPPSILNIKNLDRKDVDVLEKINSPSQINWLN